MRHSSPLPREVLAFRVSISPVAGSRQLGLRSFLKVRARALWSPPQKWKPREPRHHPPRALLAHLIEGRRARGRAEGSPAEKSPSACGRRLHDGAGSDWVRLPRARAGPGGSERGHPTVAEQTGPLSLCMGGGATYRRTGISTNRSCRLTWPSYTINQKRHLQDGGGLWKQILRLLQGLKEEEGIEPGPGPRRGRNLGFGELPRGGSLKPLAATRIPSSSPCFRTVLSRLNEAPIPLSLS